MKKKKLKLSEIKIKSFTAILPKAKQRTAKGGAAIINNRVVNGQGSWTEIKSGKDSIAIDLGAKRKSHIPR